MKTVKFPLLITEQGVSAKIRQVTKTLNGSPHTYYVVEYILLGKRKQEWRADLGEAKQAAQAACRRICNGQQSVLELSNHDRLLYLRATEVLRSSGVPLDVAASEFAQATAALNGKGTLLEAVRDFTARHTISLPKILVPLAVQRFTEYAEKDGKSAKRQQDLASVLDRFAKSFNVEVHTVTPKLISDYLTALPFKERTKRNHRDMIRYFGRWLVLQGFLPKGTNLLEGVQNYSARKIGEITTYTPEEMSLLLHKAHQRLLPFLVIAGFAGLRHAEIARLDWRDIDLEEGFIEVKAENAKTDTRRIVPIKDNLRAWLLPIAKPNGRVMEIINIANALTKLSKKAQIKWKHNALRHTYISARVAECADVPRVADEAGNSPQIIRTNYLKRMRPALAAAWFGIVPASAEPPSDRIVPAPVVSVASVPELAQAA